MYFKQVQYYIIFADQTIWLHMLFYYSLLMFTDTGGL
jgi:hypothetical protein